MPLLTPEQEELLGEQPWKCPKCGKNPYKNYCRQCDEFFYVCDCEPDKEDDHTGHRTY